MTRDPIVAGMFYPADAHECTREIEAYLRAVRMPEELLEAVAAIVPHAGWAYSAETAAHGLISLTEQEPETVVLFGAVHVWGVPGAALYDGGAWRTPLGELEVDDELAQAVLNAERLVIASPEAHSQEHAIEVQLPFIKQLLPETRILPLAMPPIAEAVQVGRAVAQAAQELGRRVVALGSTDLTHYGPRYGLTPVGVGNDALAWAHENDRRVLALMEALDADGVLREVRAHHNACGAGAVAATIGFAIELGATHGVLLHYTTSHEVMPMGRPRDFVGYGAVALVK